jgi:glycosyltransferase involved in cell wall biosynthesis
MKTLLSTVTPVYQGERFLVELVEELHCFRQEVGNIGCPLELAEAIFVVDGATDKSVSILEDLQGQYSWVRIINLSNNFGQHPATIAGILFSTGDWIVTIDEDLQHHPKHILEFLKSATSNEFDIVYAQSTASTHTAFRNASSRIAKAIMSLISGNPNISNFNSFRLMRGDIARAAAALATSNTYFDVALSWFTNRVGTLQVPLLDPRKNKIQGSGYNLNRLLKHYVNLTITSDTKLFRTGIVLGGLSFTASIVLIIVTLLIKFLAPDLIILKGWTSLFLMILFFGGLISLMVAIGLEYIGNLYTQSQGKPTFFVVDRKSDKLLTNWFDLNSI